MKKRVVISGVGCITPIGNNISNFWNSLSAGKSGVAELTRFESKTGINTVSEIKNWNPLDSFEKKEVKRYTRHNLFALKAVGDAIHDAGLDLNTVDKRRFGVIFSSIFGGIEALENDLDFFGEANKTYNSYLIPNLCPDITTGVISIKYGLEGINYAIGTACSSSLDAIIEAYKIIAADEADYMIAGGTEAPITKNVIHGFASMKALSTKKDNVSESSKPFDRNRDGFVLGEGAGCVVVESYESAKQREATIYGEIIGFGRATDIYHITSPDPSGKSGYEAMSNAIKMASLDANGIDYISAHATATPLGDISEANAIEKLFVDQLSTIRVSAVKSMTGHMMSASGAVATIATLLSMKFDTAIPTMNLQELDNRINPAIDFLPNRLGEPINLSTCLINAFGFGGKNASIIVRKINP
ncbi:beta-ketoacyl-ACP synthase II [Spirosoma migulaei]